MVGDASSPDTLGDVNIIVLNGAKNLVSTDFWTETSLTVFIDLSADGSFPVEVKRS
jgi:hypothetical protein